MSVFRRRQTWIAFLCLMVIAVALVIWFRLTPPRVLGNLQNIAAMSGIALPSNAELVFVGDGGREGDGVTQWVVYSPGPFPPPTGFTADDYVPMSVDKSQETLEALIGRIQGRVTGAEGFQWKVQGRTCSAEWLTTQKGHYLMITRF